MSHIQKCRKIITLKLPTAEVHWWKSKQVNINIQKPDCEWVRRSPKLGHSQTHQPTSSQRRPQQAVVTRRDTRQRRSHRGTGCRPLLPALQLSVWQLTAYGRSERGRRASQRGEAPSSPLPASPQRCVVLPLTAQPPQPPTAATGSSNLKMAPHLPPAPPPAGTPRGAEHPGSRGEGAGLEEGSVAVETVSRDR